jgi:hypothetical protein
VNWIKIEDLRKPNEQEQVMVWLGNTFTVADYHDGEFHWGTCRLGGVTHWARPKEPRE